MATEIGVEAAQDFPRAIMAASGRVASEYFSLPIAGSDDRVARERVYCYELYHQLRVVLLETRLTLTLTAEPDKRGHPDFKTGHSPNPDFVFHIPGGHQQNVAVVEVECRPDYRHLLKDLKTLKLMRSKGYAQLVLLLFGTFEFPSMDLINAASEAQISLEEIIVLFHKSAGSQAERVYIR